MRPNELPLSMYRRVLQQLHALAEEQNKRTHFLVCGLVPVAQCEVVLKALAAEREEVEQTVAALTKLLWDQV